MSNRTLIPTEEHLRALAVRHASISTTVFTYTLQRWGARYELRETGYSRSYRAPVIDLGERLGERVAATWKMNANGHAVGARTLERILRDLGDDVRAELRAAREAVKQP